MIKLVNLCKALGSWRKNAFSGSSDVKNKRIVNTDNFASFSMSRHHSQGPEDSSIPLRLTHLQNNCSCSVLVRHHFWLVSHTTGNVAWAKFVIMITMQRKSR